MKLNFLKSWDKFEFTKKYFHNLLLWDQKIFDFYAKGKKSKKEKKEKGISRNARIQ